MSEMMIAIVLTVLVVVAVIGVIFFALARAGGPLAVETGQQLAIVRRRMRDPVSGILRVTGVSEPSFDTMDCAGQVTGVLSGEGMEPRAVQRKAMIRVARWPSVGQQLPIIVDRANPKLFFVDQSDWDTGGDVALDEAERLAAEMKAGTD